MGACPTHIDVPRFIKKIASGNVMGSAKAILEANVLGASCSRVCPVEVLCEGSCVMHGKTEKPIEIGRLQRFAMETFYAAGGKCRCAIVQSAASESPASARGRRAWRAQRSCASRGFG